MQIKALQTNIEFNGIYRLPNTPENAAALKQYVIPVYNHIKRDKLFIFPGNNPFRISIDIIMDIVGKLNHSSKDWVKMNAQNHNINLTNIEEEPIHIISTKKDCEKLKKYLETRTSRKHFLSKKLKHLFKSKINIKDNNINLPEHLNLIFIALKRNNEENIAFSKFAKNAIDVTSPQELLSFLITE